MSKTTTDDRTPAQKRAAALVEARTAFREIGRAEDKARKAVKRALRRRDVSYRDVAGALGLPLSSVHTFVNGRGGKAEAS